MQMNPPLFLLLHKNKNQIKLFYSPHKCLKSLCCPDWHTNSAHSLLLAHLLYIQTEVEIFLFADCPQ
jgi:hypothetical protein